MAWPDTIPVPTENSDNHLGQKNWSLQSQANETPAFAAVALSEGHQAADCLMGTKGNGKGPSKPKETTLRRMEVVEFPSLTESEGTLTKDSKTRTESDNRRDNNPLINRTIIPVTI